MQSPTDISHLAGMKKLFILSSSFLLLTSILFAQTDLDKLKREIATHASKIDGQLGAAVMDLQTKDTLLYNLDGIFPMQSVYKFPVALAVLKKVDQGKLSLDQKIRLTKRDLLPDTWSPLREKYPDANVDVTLEEVLRYMVVDSDNNGCDILFRLLGGTGKVHQYVQGLGVTEIAIKATEEEMHTGWDPQFLNWCKPRAMLRLLELFYDEKLLSPRSHALLWKMMAETSTGPNRIKGLLPKGTEVLHRTGLGPTNNDGRIGAVNDVGIVRLPDGKYFAIVVYISRVKAEVATAENVIAQIALAAYTAESMK
jgi:beta-lactamase class A